MRLARSVVSTVVPTVVIACFATGALADVYSDGTLTADLKNTNGDVSGTFKLNDQTFPATGHVAADGTFTGSFKAGGNAFDFTGKWTASTLTLNTGDKAFTLARKDAPVNPLAAAAPANPLAGNNATNATPAGNTATASITTPPAAPAAAAIIPPPGYTVVTQTENGLSLKTAKNQAKTVQTALSATLPDLAGLLDGKPTVVGAVEDQKDHASGVLVFTGTQKGKAVRGVASCQLNNNGADVSVVLCDASAPPEAWQKLSSPPPPVASAADKVPMHDYQMPDGTGTIGLPEGWTTQATSMLDPISIDGPDDAKVTINGSVIISTPDCTFMQLYHQNTQRARQMGIQAPPPPQGLFAAFAAPADAVKTLIPQINELCRQQNLPTVEPVKQIAVLPTPSQLPNGRAQLIEDTAYHIKPDGTRTLMHGVGRYESAMLGKDAWMIQLTSLVSRDDQFAKLQPTMAAILNSGKINQEQCNRVGQQRAEAMQRQLSQTAANNRANLDAQFQAGQAAHREQMASYDRYNHNWAVSENLKSRSADNFIEYIGGTRDIVDTQTGRRTNVDLNSAGGIVDSLNQNDPGRFAQIPLRDDKDPLIGH